MAFFHTPKPPGTPVDATLPRVSVLTAVHNEAHQIEEKIRDILACDYPAPLLEVLVASDGSNDGTVRVVEGLGHANLQLFHSDERLGKGETQSRAMSMAGGHVVVFTDADTRFEPSFLRRIIAPFSDPNVGGVDGRLLFKTDQESGISRSQGRYWDYELQVRALESRLGLLSTGSGAAFAFRKDLFRPVGPGLADDCVVPLGVLSQGYRLVHAPDAVAYDRMAHDGAGELQNRIRMTLLDLQGTFLHKRLINPFVHPGYAFSLWSHKLLRWLSPLFLMGLSVSTFLLAGDSLLFAFFSAGLVCFYVAGLVGWVAEKRGLPVPVVKTCYSFLLANLGFLVALIRLALGRRAPVYWDGEGRS